jgi:hypothetical protein
MPPIGLQQIKLNKTMTNDLAKVIADALKPELTTIIREAIQAAQQPQDDELLTPTRLRKMLKISEATEWHWRKQGRLPYFRVNRLIYYKKSDVLAAIAEKK